MNKVEVIYSKGLSLSYFESFLLGVTPHFLVMTGLVVDAIHHDERKVTVVDLFLERFRQTRAITRFQIRLILILKNGQTKIAGKRTEYLDKNDYCSVAFEIVVQSQNPRRFGSQFSLLVFDVFGDVALAGPGQTSEDDDQLGRSHVSAWRLDEIVDGNLFAFRLLVLCWQRIQDKIHMIFQVFITCDWRR